MEEIEKILIKPPFEERDDFEIEGKIKKDKKKEEKSQKKASKPLLED